MWTKEMELKLTEIYPSNKNDDISKIMGMSKSSIINKAWRLGLRKSKKHLAKVASIRNKKVGRDLNIDMLSYIASKYKTRSEFQYNDPSAYVTSRNMGILDEICEHMVSQSYSIPQMICKFIFDDITGLDGIYNDRDVIHPYEIDVYYPEYKLGIEYNGKRWHKDDKHSKIDICNKIGISLITIVENSRDYINDIKSQIIENIDKLNIYLSRELDIEYILNMEIDNSIFDRLIDREEIHKCISKYKSYSDFRKNEINLYNKLRRIGKLEEFTHKLKRSRVYWDLDKVKITIKKYEYLSDFINGDYGCYLYVKKNGLDYMISNLNRRTQKF